MSTLPPSRRRYNLDFSGSSAWNPSASTPWRNAWPTSKPAASNCGGIFDFEDKQRRLAEIAAKLEDPALWNDPKRAQELGRERKVLDAVVSTLAEIDSGLRDAQELFEIARSESDDATLGAIDTDARKL